MYAYMYQTLISSTTRSTSTLFPAPRTCGSSSPLSTQSIHMTRCTPNTPPGSFYRRQLPSTLTDLNSAQGKKRFKSALLEGNAEAFFPLVSQFQTQSHPALCGLTTLSVVLNALGIDPKRVWEHPWRWFTEALLDCCMDMARIKTVGITIDQLARTARCQGTDVEILRNLTVHDARELVMQSVRGKGDGEFEFVIASYDRKMLGQTGSGHFSPVAAYDTASDTVLVLDVARFKYGPHWVPFQELFDATQTKDSATSLSRGFMTIRKASSDERAFCEMDESQETDACSLAL